MEKIKDRDLINQLYMKWVNEEDVFKKNKIKEEIKEKIPKEDFLKYSAIFAIPFKAFRDIYSVKEFLETLRKMEDQGENINQYTKKTITLESIEDIQGLNQFAQKSIDSKVGDMRILIRGGNLFKYGDAQMVGRAFPNAYVNFIDISVIDELLKKDRKYKGVPISITIDNIGELPLDKLKTIEERFDVIGVRIVEKEREKNIYRLGASAIYLEDYKKIRNIVDRDYISMLYISEEADKMTEDIQLTTQLIRLLNKKVKYNRILKISGDKMSEKEYDEYYKELSNLTGLITGGSICGGKAEILRNLLSCVNVRCKTIIGETTSEKGHAWNQVELGEKWVNADVTWAANLIEEGKPVGSIFMSDEAFFGDLRKVTFEKGKISHGINLETEVEIGGHGKAFDNNMERCKSYVPPYITNMLLRDAKKYEEEYKKGGNSPDYKGVVPYVGSNAQKKRLLAIENEKTLQVED